MIKMYKIRILVVALITLTTYGQEHKTILEAPTDWKSEIILFPLSFAPGIDLTGYEDLRFTPNWNKPNSSEFWSYMFVWYVDKDEAMSKDRLTMFINRYYDGLMNIKSQNLEPTDTTLEVSDHGYAGVARVYDNFFTKSYMNFNITITVVDCNATKQLIRFHISPKPFEDEVWSRLQEVKIILACNPE